nr:hypothetical protein [uncultured Flavobacterium sp.]
MENINDLIEHNINFIKNKPNFGIRRLELKNLDGKTLSNNDCISLYKILLEESLISENGNNYLFLTGRAEKIITDGGWLKHLNNEKSKSDFIIEKELLDFEKSKIDFELSKKLLKEYPYTKWFARLGFLIAVVLAILEIIQWKSK